MPTPDTFMKQCPKCKGTGSYRIPVSSPFMAPYGLDDTTEVPCECKIRGHAGFIKDTTPDTFEEKKRIHKLVIESMDEIGYGLLKDGKTFYQKGYELDITMGITFSMHQAYEIHKVLSEAKAQEREKITKEGLSQAKLIDKAILLGVKEEREIICSKIKSIFEKNMSNDACVYEITKLIDALSTKG
jgi:hypothetical protein